MKSNNTPSIFVIFGAVGDLSTKKIIPSLWHLFIHDRLPDKIAVIGFSRGELSVNEFHTFIQSAIEKKYKLKIDRKKLEEFFEFISYHAGTFEDLKSFVSLAVKIKEIESAWGVCTNKLFYLATPPVTYENIFTNLAKVELNTPCGGELGWSRVLIEKPFGTDLKTANELQKLISGYFTEDQIYRIDHYLFKEIIQGIENFRFSNNLFETVWDNTTIERIDIKLHETIGVEGRGSFYDSIGTLRDVGQNHLLAMLSAITMEYPKMVNANITQNNRALVLNNLKPWTKETLIRNVKRSQYQDYKKIKGVSEDSNTETYFSLTTELLNSRFSGIPIHMESGKKMPEAVKEIILTLKHPNECLLCEIGNHKPNRIIFRMEPNDEIKICFSTKSPGYKNEIEERVFSFFLYEKETREQYVEEYARIIYAAVSGERTRFVSSLEVENSWKFIDPITEAFSDNLIPLTTYSQITKEEIKNKIGIVGLGKMGANLARQLQKKGWDVHGFNKTFEVTKTLVSEGINAHETLPSLVENISTPRTIWLMVPHQAVDGVLSELLPLLSKGDTVIDGGNSPYKESVRRAKEVKLKGIDYMDVGVSGGPGGALTGACTMVGGDKASYVAHENLFKDMSLPNGYGYMGDSGTGHFVKMIHNGIEYGMMQSIAEGFHVLKVAPFNVDIANVAELYNHGSVITSSLVGWLSDAYVKFGPDLDSSECCSTTVSHSGEAEWTIEAAKELGVSVDLIKGALDFRKSSGENPNYTGRVVSAMRHQFGGHDASQKQ